MLEGPLWSSGMSTSLGNHTNAKAIMRRIINSFAGGSLAMRHSGFVRLVLTTGMRLLTPLCEASSKSSLKFRPHKRAGSKLRSRSSRTARRTKVDIVNATSGKVARTQGQRDSTTAQDRSILHPLAVLRAWVGLAHQRSTADKSTQSPSLGTELQGVTLSEPKAGSVDRLFFPIRCHFQKALQRSSFWVHLRLNLKDQGVSHIFLFANPLSRWVAHACFQDCIRHK
jgi:hypothetical protein